MTYLNRTAYIMSYKLLKLSIDLCVINTPKVVEGGFIQAKSFSCFSSPLLFLEIRYHSLRTQIASL